MMSVRLVLHGKQAQNPAVRAAVAAERAAGHRIEVRVTWEGGDGARLAEEASRLGFERVAAGGGDGTINEVASGLLAARSADGRGSALAVVPLGTANDFAHACHIPLDPAGALNLATNARPRRIDVGRVSGRPFINMATGGFGTEITVETRPELKKALKGAAYLVTGLTHLAELRPVKARFTGPDLSWKGELLVLAVGNGRQAGGGHVLAPEAKLDDGLLDLGILPDVPHGERGKALRELLKDGKVALWRHAVTARLPWVQLDADEPVQVNLDGEPISGKTLRFEILPGALEACLPEDAPVVGKA
ncbi:MAG TPA: lipid kinase YegS [Myxococcaceae bacterium]|nr:lipid kinase YegS [Myxococcaceae bacterium]